jgi:predicted phosphoribosyltransferase
MRYRDRSDAGSQLGAAVAAAGYGDLDSPPLVLGVPRGGVPVAAAVADHIGGELSVAMAHKVGAPGNPEFAIGAIAGDGEPLINRDVVRRMRVPESYLDAEVARQRDEIRRRELTYRSGRAAPVVAGRTVIVVDDGVATGSTLIAVLRSVRAAGSARLCCAIPVGPPDTVRKLGAEADEVICPLQPQSFMAVGTWYDDFTQVSDDAVVATLQRNPPDSG